MTAAFVVSKYRSLDSLALARDDIPRRGARVWRL